MDSLVGPVGHGLEYAYPGSPAEMDMPRIFNSLLFNRYYGVLCGMFFMVDGIGGALDVDNARNVLVL